MASSATILEGAVRIGESTQSTGLFLFIFRHLPQGGI